MSFRAECVREKILRDPKSAEYLQRKHVRLLQHGRSSKARAASSGAHSAHGVSRAYAARVRELQREGGEPREGEEPGEGVEPED